MSVFRRLSTRLLLANLLVLAVGASFVVTFRVSASEVFDRRLRGLGRGGPPSTRSGNGQTLVETFQSSVDVALLVSLAIGVVAAGFVAWFVSRRMVEPVTRIRDTTRSMARGHYDERVEVPAVEELAALATDVNELALTLDETETRRARLILEVTHELRTPLTSIDGYVEGAMDGVFSTEEISAEDLPHVFDRFFRSAGGRRRAGSGLGLSVSCGLVEAHDGELIAASDGPGRGTRFTLRLPLI